MFGAPPPRGRVAFGLAQLPEQIQALAKQLPPNLRMGTSSWSSTGWSMVWNRTVSQRTVAREGLPIYAKHPLFRSVGLDRTYYAPMTCEQLASLRTGLPDDFRMLVKAHAEVTTVRFADRSWYRGRAGQRNELFLEPEYATKVVVEPFIEGLGPHAGVMLFQFPPQHIPGGPKSFAHRLEDFLLALPKGPSYAVEIRNAELLTPRYVRALENAGASHCIAELPDMPEVGKQWEVTGGPDRPMLVMRWMLARHHDYESAREAYEPFDRLVDENPEVRKAYVRIIRDTPRPAYMIVNNKAEGSSPLSIQRLAEMLVG